MTDDTDFTEEDQRVLTRRTFDVKTYDELYIFKAEVVSWKKTIKEHEKELEERIKAVEKSNARLETQLAGAKGALWGTAVILSGVGYLILDRIKELFIK